MTVSGWSSHVPSQNRGVPQHRADLITVNYYDTAMHERVFPPPEKASSSTDSTNRNLRTASPSLQAGGTTAPQNLASPPSRPKTTSRKTTHQKHVPLPAPNLAMLPQPGACSNLQTLSHVLRPSKATVNYDQKSCHFCNLGRPEGNKLDSQIL